jgi:hypothetical protein
MSNSPLAGQVDLKTKLDKSGGTYTGVKETQLLSNVVDGAGQTINLDYTQGQTQVLTISSADAFTLDFTNWPTTEAGAMTLIVNVAAGITPGTVTWPTTKNTAPDFTGITADTGYGIYQIFFAAGNYYIFVVEEA